MITRAYVVVLGLSLSLGVSLASALVAQPAPQVTLEKSTNGFGADTPPGPAIVIGSAVMWTYRVTDTGSENLTSVQVVDDQGVAVSCPKTTLAPKESMTCTASGVAQAGQYANVGTVAAITGTSLERVSATDPSHYFGVLDQPAIDLEKATDGADADLAPGPFLLVGTEVSWTYLVTNTGNLPLSDITVVDDQSVNVACPQSLLQPGESMTCTAFGTVELGQYANLGTATGYADVEVGGEVSDSDPSHYLGVEPGPSIQIEKATNGFDADVAPGPAIPAGAPVTWTYVVTSLTDQTLFGVDVSDDQGVAVTCPQSTLAPGESMTCSASGTAELGQYANVGTVTAYFTEIDPVSATDPSHYLGFPTSDAVDLQKATEGIDADLPPGPALVIGDPVTWTYVVTNTGAATLTHVVVADDQGVTVTCPKDTLASGEAMTCTASGIVQPGPYSNLGTVTAELPSAGPLPLTVSAGDASHYFGAAPEPAIELRKATNGVDADSPPGPSIPVGSPVTWTYRVTNTGLGTLTGISVNDDQGVAVSCPGTTLASGQSMTCTASGTAQAGQYENLGTVTADPPSGPPVTAVDPSHYFGGLLGPLHIEKTTLGSDADLPPGPSLAIGTAVEWTYVVTNSGSESLTEVVVTDSDPSVTVDCPAQTLAPGETMTCTASGTVAEGAYENVGAVSARRSDERLTQASDPSHYFGRLPQVVEIPALSPRGLFGLALLLAAGGALLLRRSLGGG